MSATLAIPAVMLNSNRGYTHIFSRRINSVPIKATYEAFSSKIRPAATSLYASTAHRLLAFLANRGYVRKDPQSGKYRLTLRLYEISRRGQRVEKIFLTR